MRPHFVGAYALLNRRACREVLNLPHDARDQRTSNFIRCETCHCPQFNNAHSGTDVTNLQKNCPLMRLVKQGIFRLFVRLPSGSFEIGKHSSRGCIARSPTHRQISCGDCDYCESLSGLLDGTCNLRENGIGVRSNQSNGPGDDDQDHCEHDGIFGYILSGVLCPQAFEVAHINPAQVTRDYT